MRYFRLALLITLLLVPVVLYALHVGRVALATWRLGDGVVAAAYHGDLAAVRRALAAGEDPNTIGFKGMTALDFAAYDGDTSIVAALVEAGADPNKQNHLTRTPIFMAALTGNVETTQMLIAHGAEVNVQDENGLTPLMMTRNVAVVSELLDAGADVTVRAADGMTALTLAESQDMEEIADLLREALRLRESPGIDEGSRE